MKTYKKRVFQDGDQVIYQIIDEEGGIITTVRIFHINLPFFAYMAMGFRSKSRLMKALFKFAHKEADKQLSNIERFTEI